MNRCSTRISDWLPVERVPIKSWQSDFWEVADWINNCNWTRTYRIRVLLAFENKISGILRSPGFDSSWKRLWCNNINFPLMCKQPLPTSTKSFHAPSTTKWVHKFSTANNRKQLLEFGLVVTRDRTGRFCCLCRSGDAYDRQNYINKEENVHQFWPRLLFSCAGVKLAFKVATFKKGLISISCGRDLRHTSPRDYV